MSSLPPMTSRQLSELRDTAQQNLVNQLCDTLMDNNSIGTMKEKIREPLADMMVQIMQNPENINRLSDSVHNAIHKSLEKSLKGSLLLYTLITSDSGFEEVKKHLSILFTKAYDEKATIRAFRGKLYAILQDPQSSVSSTQKGGKKKTCRNRKIKGTRTRKLRHVKGGNGIATALNNVKSVVPEDIVPETISKDVIPDAISQELTKKDEEEKEEKEEILENKSGENVQNTLSSSQYDLREYNDALLDEMKKNVQEVGAQMTSKMIEALYVIIKSNADTIINFIAGSVSKTVEKDEFIKQSAPVIITQALGAASSDLDKAVISTFDEIQSKDPEAAFVPTQSSFMTTYMQHLKIRLAKQVIGQ